MPQQQMTIYVKQEAKLPDNQSFTNRFRIKSESSNRLYTIAQSISGRWWACECRGWISHKHCKHLDVLCLPGNYTPKEIKIASAK